MINLELKIYILKSYDLYFDNILRLLCILFSIFYTLKQRLLKKYTSNAGTRMHIKLIEKQVYGFFLILTYPD